MILDQILPSFHYHEVHSIHIPAQPEAVFRAIKEVTLQEMPFVKALFWLRRLPFLEDQKPILQQMLQEGFSFLGEEKNKEVVFGALSQPWKLGAKPVKVEGIEAFVGFRDDEVPKIAMNFYLERQEASDEVRLVTETRIAVADPRSRRKFAAYWFIIYPGSSFIRRMWLLAIKRRATQRGRISSM